MDKIIRKPRIAISSEALRMIKIWATLENKTADEKLSELVISSSPNKVKELVISEGLRLQKVNPELTSQSNRDFGRALEKRDVEAGGNNVASVNEIARQKRLEKKEITTAVARPTRSKEPNSTFNLVGPLHDNFEAQAEIIRLYNEGVAIRQMHKHVGYAEATIRGFINKKVKNGELAKKF